MKEIGLVGWNNTWLEKCVRNNNVERAKIEKTFRFGIHKSMRIEEHLSLLFCCFSFSKQKAGFTNAKIN